VTSQYVTVIYHISTYVTISIIVVQQRAVGSDEKSATFYSRRLSEGKSISAR